MPNKIVDKYLAPYRLGAAVAIPLIIVGANAMNKFHKLNMKMVENKYVDSVDSSYYFAATIGLILALYLIWGGLYAKPKQANRFTEEVATQYLNSVFSETPELEHYFHIMYDPKSIKSVGTFICNALPDDKRKEILDIVRDLERHTTKNADEYNSNVREAINKIVNIIKDYSAKHHDFECGVNDVIAHRYTTYIMPTPRVR